MGDAVEPQGSTAEITGRAIAAGGLIEAVVGANGRLVSLRLDPDLGRHGPRGTMGDSTMMAREICAAVNAALDDLEEQIRTSTDNAAHSLANDLDAIAEDFERSLDQLATDIVKAERRLES